MKQVLLKKGQAVIKEVPAPVVSDKEILIRVSYSCISTGTEVSALKNTGTALYRKVLNKPKKAAKVLDMLREKGLSRTISRIKTKLDSAIPVGYSASGIVLETGSGIKDIFPGDLVACGGAGIANHAEFVAAPRNLCVKIPGELQLDLASTVTIGSIAMQGIRRADAQVGQLVSVTGLGILGQLAVRILKVSGCRVIGIDLDPKRIETAYLSGMDKGINPAECDVVDELMSFSGSRGVDSAIIAASCQSSEVMNQAMKFCRRKGKVVIIGSVGMDLERQDFYNKELDVLMSTSCGPGRYDENYEQKGCDYPYDYVRWTENRNMAEYLRLVETGQIDIRPLIDIQYPIEKASEAYDKLAQSDSKPLMILLKYDDSSEYSKKIIISSRKPSVDKLNIALIGAGNFAGAVHLPNISGQSKYFNISAIICRTGSKAEALARQYNVRYACTDYHEVLKDSDINVVFITTRHNLHTEIAIDAARAGKAIFLEKPAAMNRQQLRQLADVLEEKQVAFTVGFNRRFSPYSRLIKETTDRRTNPMVINYRMNAGYLPKDSWLQGQEGGGRNIGEACHIYDLFNFLTDSEIESVNAYSITPANEQYNRNDNFVAVMKYKDGSVCNLVYTALGSREVSKEKMDIYFDGKIISLDDFRELKFHGINHSPMRTSKQEKGLPEELEAFAKSIRSGTGYSIPFWQIAQASEISFDVEEQIMMRPC